MKGYPDSDGKISFDITAKTITVDWGDDTIEEMVLNGKKTNVKHTYSNNNYQTIKINTEKMTSLVISGSEIRIGNCPDLEELDAKAQTDFNIKEAKSLTKMRLYYYAEAEIKLNNFTSLRDLRFYSDYGTKLNVSGCTSLSSLDFLDSEFLTELNVSGCTSLSKLHCGGNILTAINISKCSKLNYIDCRSNKLTQNGLNTLFEDLPFFPIKPGIIYIGTGFRTDKGWDYSQRNPGYDTCDKSIATDRGWIVGEEVEGEGGYASFRINFSNNGATTY